MRVLLAAALAAATLAVPATAGTGSTAIASWYGPGLYGNGMACGGILTTSTNGVASKTLPCGTRLEVCYLNRCRDTVVVDRGPYAPGRDFDLAAGLAVSLGFSGVHSIRWWRR